ncbi:isochorismatase family protein [Rhizobium sp. P44RR-XXIV]|uniref:isochorismatase family protein n=1 Tax=Rhizobium sp. P44RR-XXIV TaxID=1921145 RepID=UPI000987449E|nr:isochorismatase family protein [Rhizobium sp. P44RR-XXIV]TIX92407.1 isochorismatase family protein [Rhizobium sp. P44RR-XXIV]
MEEKQEATNDLIKTADALLVVDVQNAFVEGPAAVPGHATLTSMVELLLEKARSAWAPVIFLQNDGPVGAPDEPLQAGWKLYFPPRSGELVIRKTNDDGFDGTDLDAILTSFGVRDLVISGMLSEMCVAATARAALQRGYGVLLPHDAHATYDVPAGPGSEAVPATMAARAAEWSLGDEVRICASAREVRFAERNRK